MNNKNIFLKKNSNLLLSYFNDYISSERIYYGIVLGILSLALSIRLMGLGKGIWYDEYSSLRIVFSQDFLQQLRLYNHPPLYFILLKLWSCITTREEFLRILSVFFGIGTVAVVMQWMKSYSRFGSILSGLYCATLPIMLRYSQEIRNYSLLLFATALSFYFASRLIDEPEKSSRYVWLGFSLVIVVATHLLGVMILTSVCLYLAIRYQRLRIATIKMVIPTIAVPLSVFVYIYFFFFQQLPKDPSSWWMPSFSLDLFIKTAKLVLGTDQALLTLRLSRHYYPNIVEALPIIVLGLAICLLVFGGWGRSLHLLVPALVYWVQVIIYSIFVIPIFWYRTVLPGMIPFIGFLGLQIATIRRRELKVLLVLALALLCSAYTTQWITKDARRPYERWKNLSQVLKSKMQPDDLVLFLPGLGAGLVQYYIGLPTESILPINVWENFNKIVKDINGRIAEQKKVSSTFAVFFVIRRDMSLAKQKKKYQQLLRYLESELGKPSFSKQLGILLFLKYETSKPVI